MNKQEIIDAITALNDTLSMLQMMNDTVEEIKVVVFKILDLMKLL